jgi:hypothetical protein
MSIHKIRLAGPWELHKEGSEPTRVQLPFDMPSTDDTCQLIRKFHRPSGLTDDCQVRIVVTTNTPLAVFINEEPVEPSAVSMESQSCDSAYDATALLRPFNLLSVQSRDDAASHVQAAAIEIEPNDTSN